MCFATKLLFKSVKLFCATVDHVVISQVTAPEPNWEHYEYMFG